jgi:hypothetical protein
LADNDFPKGVSQVNFPVIAKASNAGMIVDVVLNV